MCVLRKNNNMSLIFMKAAHKQFFAFEEPHHTRENKCQIVPSYSHFKITILPLAKVIVRSEKG